MPTQESIITDRINNIEAIVSRLAQTYPTKTTDKSSCIAEEIKKLIPKARKFRQDYRGKPPEDNPHLGKIKMLLEENNAIRLYRFIVYAIEFGGSEGEKTEMLLSMLKKMMLSSEQFGALATALDPIGLGLTTEEVNNPLPQNTIEEKNTSPSIVLE